MLPAKPWPPLGRVGPSQLSLGKEHWPGVGGSRVRNAAVCSEESYPGSLHLWFRLWRRKETSPSAEAGVRAQGGTVPGNPGDTLPTVAFVLILSLPRQDLTRQFLV